MTIMESANAMNTDFLECNATLNKIDLFAEAAYREYEINLKEIALKVMKESGTEEDYNFLATEAVASYIERAKKVVEKIIDAVKKFIRNCKENLIKMLSSEKAKMAMKKVEEVCETDPNFRSAKVTYQDTDKQVSMLQQGMDRLRKKVAKVKARGVSVDKDFEELEEIVSDTEKKTTAIAVAATITVATAVGLYMACNSPSEIEKILDDNEVSDCEVVFDADNTQTAQTASFYTKVTGFLSKLKKEIASKRVIKNVSLFQGIKKAIAERGKTSRNIEGMAKEFVLEDLDMFKYVAESVEETNDEEPTVESVGVEEGLDLDAYFSEMCDELFTAESEEDDLAILKENSEDFDDEIMSILTESSGEMYLEGANWDLHKKYAADLKTFRKYLSTAKKLYKDSKFDEARTEVNDAIEVLKKNRDTAIDSFDNDTMDKNEVLTTIFGIILRSICLGCKFILLNLFTLRIGDIVFTAAWLAKLVADVKDIINAAEKIKEKGNFDVKDLNLYKNFVEKEYKRMITALETFLTKIDSAQSDIESKTDVKKESVEETNTEEYEEMTAESYLEKLESEVFTESEETDESEEDEDTDTEEVETVESYLEKLESEVLGESTESSEESEVDEIQSLLDEMEALL